MKKIIALVLTLAMTLTLAIAAFTVGAAGDDTVGYSPDRVEKVTDWSKIYNITKYDELEENPTAYKILNADGLIKLSEIVNSGDGLYGVTVYLAYDIDMTGKVMDPIGRVGGVPFKGTFDGQGHVIDNLKLRAYKDANQTSGATYGGLFGAAFKDASFKNIVLGSGCEISNDDPAFDARTGGIVGNSNGVTIDNCMVAATVKGGRWTGGIVGFINTDNVDLIQNCTFTGATSDTGRGSGGIVGANAKANTTVKNCRNTGTITSANVENGGTNTIAGGIVFRSWGKDLVIEGCINNGTVTGTTFAGGIIGGQMNLPATVTGCINYGTVSVTVAEGGIADGIFGTAASGGAVNADATTLNKAGETDSTLASVPTITPSYPTQAEIDAAHKDTDGEVQETTTPEETTTEEVTTEEVTTVPEKKTEAPTKAPETPTEAATTGTASDDSKGCSSAVFGSMAIIFVAAGAVLTFKKKH